jgi:Spy/CpxP family protein refolding chaperone
MKKLMSTIAMLVMVASMGFAQDGPAAEKPHGKHRAMLDQIPDLTEDQRTQIVEIRENSKKQMRPQRDQLKKIRMQLMEMKTDENPDQAKINALIDEQTKLKGDMLKTRTEAELKVRSILTPEQQNAMDSMRKEKQEKRQKQRGERKSMEQTK